MNYQNIDLKAEITRKGYTFKKAAELLGITPEWFSRMLAKPLCIEEKEAILLALDGDLSVWRTRHMMQRNMMKRNMIIMCKDCNRNYGTQERPSCDFMNALLKPDSFCSYGERKV